MAEVMKAELKFKEEKFSRENIRQGDKRHSYKLLKEKDRERIFY